MRLYLPPDHNDTTEKFSRMSNDLHPKILERKPYRHPWSVQLFITLFIWACVGGVVVVSWKLFH